MNNGEKLRELKGLYGVTSQTVADILGVSKKTVDCWLLAPGASNHRNMRDIWLNQLKRELEE